MRTALDPSRPLATLRGLPAPARYLLAFALMPAIAAAGLPALGTFGIYWGVCPVDIFSAGTRLLGFWLLLLAVVALPSRTLRVDSTHLMLGVSAILVVWLIYTRVVPLVAAVQ